jgi:hypothetical protein
LSTARSAKTPSTNSLSRKPSFVFWTTLVGTETFWTGVIHDRVR